MILGFNVLQHEPLDQQSLEAQVQFVHRWFNCLARSSIKSEGHNLSSRLLAADPTDRCLQPFCIFTALKQKTSTHLKTTPPKINIEPENGGLEDVSPFPGVHFQVPCLFWGVYVNHSYHPMS